MTTFNIFAIVPQYDYRDGICGHKAYREPNTYLTPACALAIARRRDGEAGGDGIYFVVVQTGASAFDDRARIFPPARSTDDIPF